MSQEIQVVEKQFNDVMSLISDVGLEIENQDQYENCMLAIQRSKEIGSKWIMLFDDIRAAQKAALDVTYETINKVKVPCENNVKALGPKCFRWQRKIEAEARAEQDRIAAAAKKLAEDAMLEEAAHLHSQGDKEAADAVLSTPVAMPPVIVVQANVKPKFTMSAAPSLRTKWKARVTNIDLLVKAVAEGKVAKSLVIENQTLLDKMADSLKKELNVPGVEVYEDPIYSRGRA